MSGAREKQSLELLSNRGGIRFLINDLQSRRTRQSFVQQSKISLLAKTIP
jgi:hypothetical protein